MKTITGKHVHGFTATRVLVAAAAVAVVLFAPSHARAASGLVLSESNFDFGSQPLTSATLHHFTLTNGGTTDAEAQLFFDSGYFVTRNDSCFFGSTYTLAAGASCSFDVEFKPLAPGPQTGSIEYTYDVGKATVHLTGAGIPDTVPPVLTLPGTVTAEAIGPGGASVVYTATAVDTLSGDSPVTCDHASGDMFSIATTTVSCGAIDAAGNTASGTFDVIVRDTTGPAFAGADPVVAEATGPAGAVATFSPSATDLVDGAVSVVCDHASGAVYPLGAPTHVTCSASDSRQNASGASFDVTARDTTPPSLALPADQTVTADASGSATVTYTASAADLVDGSVPISCAPGSGSSFRPGSTTVNCSATDARGNNATGTFKVNVLYRWSGLRAPVNNPPTLNIAKAGSAIPVKFSLSGNQGLAIFYAGFPKVQDVSCASLSDNPTDPVETTTTAGASSLSYDASADQYVYVWKTQSTWSGSCRRLDLKLADGTLRSAYFSFK